MNIIEDLQYRGLINQQTNGDGLNARLKEGPITLYAGFDPTADSLHFGHLLVILLLRRFQLAGHKPIALVGGATGLIGDPSGKSTERTLNDLSIVEEWSGSIRKQLERFLDFSQSPNQAVVENNFNWIGKLNVIDFLRGIGKHFSIAAMVSRDSVKSRLEGGLSYTEFSYMLFQAYDFLKLYENYKCELQAGGSDQWGNIVSGADLVRKFHAKEAFGITIPLVTKPDGTKYGKTEGGAVWLDPKKTSPYQFYQFWINIDDQNVIKFIKFFTFLDHEKIDSIEKEHLAAPEKRIAHKILATEVTTLVHGADALKKAEKISQALFYGNIKELAEDELKEGFSDVPSTTMTKTENKPLADILVETKVVSSKRQAREDIQSGAISVNGAKVTDVTATIKPEDLLFSAFTVIKRGKKNYHLVKWSL